MRNFKLLPLFALLLVTSLLSPACVNEELTPVFGCTETDALNFNANATNNDGSCGFANIIILGEWTTANWELAGTDLMASDFTLNYEFHEGGQFEYSHIGNIIPSFTGHGTWKIIGNSLQLDYGETGINWKIASTFHELEASNEEFFTTNFEEDFNNLNLEVALGDISLNMSFDKKSITPIEKDKF